MAMRAWLPVLLVAGSLAFASCGDDTGENSSASGGGGSDAAAGMQVDDKCNPSVPYRRENTGKLAGLYRTCVTADELSLELVNTSSAMLVVRGKSSPAPIMKAASAVASTPQEAAVNTLVHTTCTGETGPCHVSPKGLLVADGTMPVALDVDVAWRDSAVAAGTTLLAGYAMSKLQSPGRQFGGRLTACAKSLRGVMRPHDFVEDAVPDAIEAGTSCKGLLRTFGDEAGLRPARPTRAAEDIFRVGNRILRSEPGHDLLGIFTINLLAKLRR